MASFFQISAIHQHDFVSQTLLVAPPNWLRFAKFPFCSPTAYTGRPISFGNFVSPAKIGFVSQNRPSQLLHHQLSLAPHRLAADSGPLRGAEIRNKFRQITFVLGFPGESADRMSLPRAGAAARHIDVPDVAPGHAHLSGALAECAEVDVQRAGAVEFAERADPVSHPSCYDPELGSRADLLSALELGRREETQAQVRNRIRPRFQAQFQRRGVLPQQKRPAIVERHRRCAVCVKLRHGRQLHAAPPRSQALPRKLRERQHEIRNGVAVQIEKIQVEVERRSGRNCDVVEVRRAKDERPGPIGQAAGARSQSRGLKQPRIRTVSAPFTIARAGALWNARDAPEDRAERAAQNVGGFAGRKVQRIARNKREPQRVKSEQQTHYSKAAGGEADSARPAPLR